MIIVIGMNPLSLDYFVLGVSLGCSKGAVALLISHVREMKARPSLYSNEERVTAFWRQIRLSSIGHEEDLILEPCYERERTDMVVVHDFLIPYLYFHLPVIYDLGVSIPFTPFEAKFLRTANVAPSEITPNVNGIIKAIDIICLSLEVTPNIRVFLYFYGVTPFPQEVG